MASETKAPLFIYVCMYPPIKQHLIVLSMYLTIEEPLTDSDTPLFLSLPWVQGLPLVLLLFSVLLTVVLLLPNTGSGLLGVVYMLLLSVCLHA